MVKKQKTQQQVQPEVILPRIGKEERDAIKKVRRQFFRDALEKIALAEARRYVHQNKDVLSERMLSLVKHDIDALIPKLAKRMVSHLVQTSRY